MNRGYRIGAIILSMAMMAGMMVTPAYAATKKKINSITVKVEGNIEIETRMGDEDLQILTTANTYDYDYYTVENSGFKWSIEDTPEIKIYLTAADNYYFNITKASQINLTGATYVQAAREDSSTTLVLTVRLPSLANQVYPIESVNLNSDGSGSWDEAIGSTQYEIKFMRGNTTLGGTQTITGTTYNGSQYMTKAGNYVLKVRPVSKNDPTITGDWVESQEIYITADQAKVFAEAKQANDSAGDWIQDAKGWWFRSPDGSYPAGAWKQINGVWYYFLADGYMATGWQQVNGKWYYLDPTSGAMWKNTTTPDGYNLGIDGSMSTN